MEKFENICNLLVYTNIPYREQLGFDKTVKFGTEIEFDKANYYAIERALLNRKLLKDWTLEDDFTVRNIYNIHGLGGEITSPILHDYKKCWTQLKSACNLIRQNKGLINDRCGAHIHIDSSILKNNPKYILNFVKLWTVYEHVIYRFAYGEYDKERKTLYDYAAPSSGYFYETILNIKEHGLIEKAQDFYSYLFQCSIFNSINAGISFLHCSGLVEDDNKNTIEVKCPNGTLNEVIWQNNINFFVKLLEYCASSRYDEEFINKKLQNYKFKKLDEYRNIYLDDAIELSNLIFEKEEDKFYFLKQYLKINENNKQIIIEKVKSK